jgi:outer membrane protein TolC
MKTKFICFLIGIFFLSWNVCAQHILTLEDCRNAAVQNNKKILEAKTLQQKTAIDVKSCQAYFLPSLSASGLGYLGNASTDFMFSIPPIMLFEVNALRDELPDIFDGIVDILEPYSSVQVPDIHFNFESKYLATAGVVLQQPLFMGGKIAAAYKMSKIGKNLADLNVERTINEITVKTDEAYWLYVQTMELKKTAIRYNTLLEELSHSVQNAYEEGILPLNDVLKVKVKWDEGQLQLRKVENGIRLSRMNLCQVIGFPLDSTFEVVDSIEIQDFIFQTETVFSRPEYAMLAKQIELKTQEVRLVRSEFLPQIGISGGYNYMYGLRLNGKNLLNSSSFSGILSVQIPVFQWFRGNNKIKSAKLEVQLAQIEQEELTEMMNLELRKAYNDYDEAKFKVKLSQTTLNQAEENLRVSRDHYQEGMMTLADYLEAQTIWQKAAADLIQAKAAQRLAETCYLRAAGKLE